MSSTAGRIVRNTGWLYAKMGITVFISLWVTRLILNSLGASDFGVYNVVGGIVAMLGFLNSAMGAATQRFMSYTQGEGDEEKQKDVFSISVALHAMIAAVMVVILIIAGIIFFKTVLNIPEDRTTAAVVVFVSMILSTMISIMSVPFDAVLNAHENMKYFALIGIFESLLKLAVAFVCVYTSSDKLIVYGILMSLIPFITIGIMIIYCRRNYQECSFNLKRCRNVSLFAEMGKFAGWNFLGSATSMISNYGMNLVVNSFFGTLLNAAQGIAGQLNGQVMAFSNNLMRAVNPVIAKTEGAGERKQMLEMSFTGCKFSYFTVAVIAIPLLIEAPYVLKIWLKDVPEFTIVFTRLSILRSMLLQMVSILTVSIAAEGRIKGYHIWNSVISISVLLLSILAFHFGAEPYWMYIIYIIGYCFILSFIQMMLMKRNCGMSIKAFSSEVLARITLVSILSAAAGYIPVMLMEQSFVRLVLVCVSSSLMFLVSGWFVGLTVREKQVAHNLIIKRT